MPQPTRSIVSASLMQSGTVSAHDVGEEHPAKRYRSNACHSIGTRATSELPNHKDAICDNDRTHMLEIWRATLAEARADTAEKNLDRVQHSLTTTERKLSVAQSSMQAMRTRIARLTKNLAMVTRRAEIAEKSRNDELQNILKIGGWNVRTACANLRDVERGHDTLQSSQGSMKNSGEVFALQDSSDDEARSCGTSCGDTINESAICGVARYVSSFRPKVIVLLGAGASTSAGIPDFRSPGSGLYDNLQSYKLPCPTSVFDLEYFRKHPDSFYALARELWPRSDRNPTPVHNFVRILHEEGLLLRCYTQNIDGLERAAGIPDEKLVEAHGHFRSAHGVETDCEVHGETLKEIIFSERPADESRKRFGELVKPDITFFGEKLPKRFKELCARDLPACEFLIVIGTSLKVAPFASIVRRVLPSCPRVLLNNEPAGQELGCILKDEIRGGFNFDSSLEGVHDVMIQAPCDEGVRKLAKQLGWGDRLV